MKYLYLSSLCIMFGCVVQAQLSIVPQLGIENSRTTVSYNKSSSFSPLGTKVSPHASVRLDYKFKKGHGPFAGLATTRSAVNYSFSNPETGNTMYTASRDNTTLRIEGGYQFSTKPIYFNKSASKNRSKTVGSKTSSTSKSCRDFYTRFSCGSKSYSAPAPSTSSTKSTWMSIQPSAGMAFVPTASAAEIVAQNAGNATNYEYAAGNWKTAAIAGVGFAFGKGDQQKLLVSINYLQGIGNLQTESITTTSDLKPTTTYLSSNASNWNLRIGVPFNLTKTKKPATQKEAIIIKQRSETKQPAEVKQPKQEKKCGAYYYRCRKAA